MIFNLTIVGFGVIGVEALHSIISKVGKKFRWQILIHGSEQSKIPFSDRSLLLKLVPKKVILSIDVNPVQL